jgi:DNA-binding PadR family transcriptional regulator
MERKLLLLGLLRIQHMPGYQLNEVIDSHLGMSLNLKKATAYDLLKKMVDDGWVTYTEEQEGNRPPRRVYEIMPEGEAAFQQMLRESLADYHLAEFPGDISLAFLDEIAVEEALPLLHKRRAIIERLARSAAGDQHHPGSFRLVLEHQRRHLDTELTWLDEVIQQVDSKLNSE